MENRDKIIIEILAWISVITLAVAFILIMTK
jgi:hypothetical protein